MTAAPPNPLDRCVSDAAAVAPIGNRDDKQQQQQQQQPPRRARAIHAAAHSRPNPLDKLSASMAASGSSDLGAAARVLGLICVASSVSVRLGCRLIDVLFQPSSSSFSSSSSSASDEAGLLDASPAQVAAEALVSFFLIDLISGIFHVALDHADPGPLLRHVVRTSRDAVHETRSADWRYGASSAWRQVVWNFQSHHCAPFPEHDD